MKTLKNLRGPALILTLLCVLWLVVIVGLLVLRPAAYNLGTVTTILQFSTILALVALGQGLVIMAGGAGIDLSVGGAAQSGVPAWLLVWGRGVAFGIPVPFLTLAIPCFAIAGVVLISTAWGRWIYAMGFNERSARLVGIPVGRVRFILYTLSGALAGAAGLVSIAWLGSGRPNIGQNLELESLTAAMLGGVGGVFAAVLLLVTLKTGLLQLNINTVWQVGIVGALLVFVLLADRLSQRWRS